MSELTPTLNFIPVVILKTSKALSIDLTASSAVQADGRHKPQFIVVNLGIK